MTLADRVALIKNGEIQQLDTPKEIYDNPATLFVAGFIGSPAMNLIKGTVTDGYFVADGIKVFIKDGINQDNVTLGVRAEDLNLTNDSHTENPRGKYTHLEQLGDCNTVILVSGKDRITAKYPQRYHIQKWRLWSTSKPNQTAITCLIISAKNA